ncbi:hypothetical protein AGIG_G4101 [Arapaima gigas]
MNVTWPCCKPIASRVHGQNQKSSRDSHQTQVVVILPGSEGRTPNPSIIDNCTFSAGPWWPQANSGSSGQFRATVHLNHIFGLLEESRAPRRCLHNNM